MKNILRIVFLLILLISLNVHPRDLAPPEFANQLTSHSNISSGNLTINEKENNGSLKNKDGRNEKYLQDYENKIISIQSGNNNNTSAAQTGIGNNAYLFQFNGNNQLEISQHGDLNYLSLKQFGDNRAKLEQIGIGHYMEIIQAPHGPIVSIKQIGVEGFVRITQY